MFPYKTTMGLLMTSLNREQKRVLFLSSLGGALEFYDFIIYIFLAPIIEKVFFAGGSSYVATLKTLAIFSIGYLVRPLGGIVFSHFGDRYGRKVVFLLTVVGMTLPSLAISLMPTTAQIGTAAPLLLLLCRMLQGLALGGEIPAAITFVSEHAAPGRRAFSIATLFFGINFGLMLGSLVTSLVSSALSSPQLESFGWRIPFLLGGAFGLITIYLRRYLHETAAFQNLSKRDIQQVPLVSLLRHHASTVMLGMLLVASGSVTVFLYLYWPQYLSQYMHYDFATLMRINTLGTLVLSFTILMGGWITDRIGYKPAYLATIACLALTTYPLFYLFQLQNISWVIVSYSIFSIFFGFIPSAYASILSLLFPTNIRYSGIALSYNLAYAFFGGLSPLICTIAIKQFNSILAPAYYVIAICVLSGVACCLVTFKQRSALPVLETQPAT
jgi:MFS family permease